MGYLHLSFYRCLERAEYYQAEDDDGYLIECPYCDNLARIDYGWDTYEYDDYWEDEEYRRLIKYDS